MKILVTGASGFIGQHLFLAICEKYGEKNIFPLSSKSRASGNSLKYEKDYSIIERDKFKLNEIEVIIHAGAFTPKEGAESNDLVGSNSNVMFTNSLLGFDFPRLQKIIYLSTLDVYSDAKKIDESTVLGPSSLYGYSKLYCEKMIESFCVDRGLNFQVLRIGHVYGPGEEKYLKLLPIAIQKILNNKEIDLWGSGRELRSFIYIKDVVDACVAAIELKSDVGAINIVGGNSISIIDLLYKLGKLMGKEVKISQKVEKSPKRDFVFDNSKMKKFLINEETSLEDGLVQEIKYFKDRV